MSRKRLVTVPVYIRTVIDEHCRTVTSSLLLTSWSRDTSPNFKMSGKRRYCHHCGEYVCRSTFFEHQMLVKSSSKADSSFYAQQQLSVEGMYNHKRARSRNTDVCVALDI